MTATESALVCGLGGLLRKYDMTVPDDLEIQGNTLRIGALETPVFPWRTERRFVELKALAANGTLESVSTLRFAHHAAPEEALTDLMFREFDLAEFLSGADIVSVYCAMTEDLIVNSILRLRNGANAGIEISRCLRGDALPVDRHEIIAARGVASDQVVDTQIPQQSIYLYAEDGAASFTDTDAELYGLDRDDAGRVRDAFQAIRDGNKTDRNSRKAHIDAAVAAAIESAKSGQPVTI